jgi:hypothetical protein
MVAQVPPILAMDWFTITLDEVVAGLAPLAALQVTVTLYLLVAIVLVLVNAAGMLNGVLAAQAAGLLQTLLPLVSVALPDPAVVTIDAVQDTTFTGCTVKVVATAVPPASSWLFGARGEAGPKVPAGTCEPPVAQPAPDGVPLSWAARCPGTLPVLMTPVGYEQTALDGGGLVMSMAVWANAEVNMNEIATIGAIRRRGGNIVVTARFCGILEKFENGYRLRECMGARPNSSRDSVRVGICIDPSFMLKRQADDAGLV